MKPLHYKERDIYQYYIFFLINSFNFRKYSISVAANLSVFNNPFSDCNYKFAILLIRIINYITLSNMYIVIRHNFYGIINLEIIHLD